MSFHEENDSLSELLIGGTLPPADPLRREAIFARTRGVLRRRRLVRRGILIATLASCYVVGVASALNWQSLHRQHEIAVRPDHVHENSITTPPPRESIPPSEPQPVHSSADAHNPIAQSQPSETLTTFEKLRRAGDRQLNERGNLKGAILCYQRALDFASDDEWRIVPDRDSWLLISLKETHLEERKHGHKKS